MPVLQSIKVRLRPVKHLYHRLRPPVKGVLRPASTDFSAAVPFGYDTSDVSPSLRVAAVCHIFHIETAPVIRSLLNNLPPSADIAISTDTNEKAAEIEAIFQYWTGRVDVRLAPNRGRDIAPKFVTFSDVYSRYDIVLFLHSKKSLTSSIGDGWRDMLMHSLAGSPDTVRSIMDIFHRHPGIGMVVCPHFEAIREWIGWDSNFPRSRRLARRMGIRLTPGHVLDFPSGSMFWARPAALQPLLDLHLRLDDFPLENNQVRGTLAHAIERLMLFVCEQAGFRWVKVADPGFFQETSTIVPIRDRAEFDVFEAKNRIRLLG
jgi:lipopolysaccharide biosynthesis protein